MDKAGQAYLKHWKELFGNERGGGGHRMGSGAISPWATMDFLRNAGLMACLLTSEHRQREGRAEELLQWLGTLAERGPPLRALVSLLVTTPIVAQKKKKQQSEDDEGAATFSLPLLPASSVVRFAESCCPPSIDPGKLQLLFARASGMTTTTTTTTTTTHTQLGVTFLLFRGAVATYS